MANSLASMSIAQLKKAVAIKEHIEQLESELSSLLGGASAPLAVGGVIRRRRRMSAAGRARISAAAKARWAKQKGTSVEAAKPVKPKRKISAAGRRAIAAGARARWAKVKAAKAQP